MMAWNRHSVSRWRMARRTTGTTPGEADVRILARAQSPIPLTDAIRRRVQLNPECEALFGDFVIIFGCKNIEFMISGLPIQRFRAHPV